MNFLFDINHPAQVHLLKNLYFSLTQKGHSVIVTVKNIKSAHDLLSIYSIPYIPLGKKTDNLWGKLFYQLVYNLKTLWLVYRYSIKVGIGSSITIDHVSRLSPMKSIHLSDDDPAAVPFVVKYSYPFSHVIVSPDVIDFGTFSYKNIQYSGYHELAYLHPNRFTPDENVLKELGIKKSDVFFILRFNAFKAHHDIGIKGLSIQQKLKLVNILKSRGKVFITTEREIDPELKEYQLKVSPEKIHSLLYYATLLIGDSQTMTTEAALLGTPALKCNSFAGELSVHNELERKYGLCYSYKPSEFDGLLIKLDEILCLNDIKKEWQLRKMAMLSDKIDITSFLEFLCLNPNYSKPKVAYSTFLKLNATI
jgi:hypothetical protein